MWLDRGVLVGMDGRGRALDNVFIERLWWSLKHELIHPDDFLGGSALRAALLRLLQLERAGFSLPSHGGNSR